MPKLLIIDGSSMLSTSYYGNLPKSILFAKTEEEKEKHYGQILHTSDGKYTNAMFTMLRTLLGIYKKVKPEYVAFVFDKTRDTFRRTELGADFYKANRKETSKPLKEQFVQMEEFLQEIGCAVFMSDDYEADDYAASLVERFEGPDLQTYVLTKDHDYFQVVSEYTRMWRVVNKDKLEQLKEELAARAQVMQARTRRGTHLLGKGRMLRAYPKLKHGVKRTSLETLRKKLERRESDQDRDSKE